MERANKYTTKQTIQALQFIHDIKQAFDNVIQHNRTDNQAETCNDKDNYGHNDDDNPKGPLPHTYDKPLGWDFHLPPQVFSKQEDGTKQKCEDQALEES